MKLEGLTLWDLHEVCTHLLTVKDGTCSVVARAAGDDEGPRVVGMYTDLMPLMSETLLALSRALSTREDRDLEEWRDAVKRLQDDVAGRQWPRPQLAGQRVRDFRAAAEYVAELTPAVLIDACEDGPNFEQDWVDVREELAAAGHHLRRVVALENTPTQGVLAAHDRRAAEKIARERAEKLHRWKHY